ncbi:MAG: hypothetical protein ACXU86_03215 [Archangium sp.]
MKENGNPFAVTQEDGASLVNQIGFALVFLPAPAVLHYIGDPEASWPLAALLCALSGTLGGWLFGLERAPARAGLLGGLLASMGGMLLTCLCLARQESYFLGEAVFLWMFGSVPGVLIYKEICDGAARSRRSRH